MDFMTGLKRTNYCGDLRAEDCGKEVVVAGWVQRQRDLGALIFVDLRDRTGVHDIDIRRIGKGNDFPIRFGKQFLHRLCFIMIDLTAKGRKSDFHLILLFQFIEDLSKHRHARRLRAKDARAEFDHPATALAGSLCLAGRKAALTSDQNGDRG